MEVNIDCLTESPEEQFSQIWARLRDALARADSATAFDELDRLLTLSLGKVRSDQWVQCALVSLEFGDLNRAIRLYELALKCLTRQQLQEAASHRIALEWLYLRAIERENIQQLTNIFKVLKDTFQVANDECIQSLDELLSIALLVEQREIARAAHAAKVWWERSTTQQPSYDPFTEILKPYTYLLLAQLWESADDAVMSAEILTRLLGLPRVPKSLWVATAIYACLFNQVSPWYERIGIHTDWAFSDRSTLIEDVLSHIMDRWPSTILDKTLCQSLQLTWEGLKSPRAKTELLQRAVSVRPTNLLAAEALLRSNETEAETTDLILHEAQWLISQPKVFGPLLSAYIHSPASRNDVTFSFVALNGGDRVGGSCYLVNIGGKSLLLDVGLDVHTEPRLSYANLKRRIEDTGLVQRFADIDTVAISHAHLDHIGLLPVLQKDLEQLRRAQKPVYFYASLATKELARVMLEDAARIAQHSPSAALYSIETAIQAADRLKEPIDELLDPFLPGEGRISLIDSGHILGSKMIFIERQGFRVLYTGDFNPGRQLTIPPAGTLSGSRPDVLIMESTYGYRTEPLINRTIQEELLTERLDAILRRGGIVLFPAFAVGRSQEVLGLVARHAMQNPDLSYHVYVDGLSRTVTNLYDRWRDLLSSEYTRLVQQIEHRVRMVPEETDREALILTELQSGPAVVIASSGMLKHGSISHFYAQRLGQDRRNAIFFTGYLPDDSDGYTFFQARTPADQIKISCERGEFSLTAHASKADLVQFVFDIAPRAVILVHGDVVLMKDDPHNVFQCLKALDQEKIQVCIGKNGRTIALRDGRYA